jgi:hypothetical protein
MVFTNDDAVRNLLARDEIRQLAYRYAAAIEARDVDAMAELFSPKARFGRHGEGPDALRRLMVDGLSGSLLAVILVANHLIDFDSGEEARGEVWAHCYAHTAADGFVEQLIKYEDRYALSDGRWLFMHRRHRLWYGVGHTSSPLDQRAADWPDNQIGVGDIPLSDTVFAEWWAERHQ